MYIQLGIYYYIYLSIVNNNMQYNISYRYKEKLV